MKSFLFKTTIDRQGGEDCNSLVLISLKNKTFVAYYLVMLIVKEIK
jgi:hypothetical protein